MLTASAEKTYHAFFQPILPGLSLEGRIEDMKTRRYFGHERRNSVVRTLAGPADMKLMTLSKDLP